MGGKWQGAVAREIAKKGEGAKKLSASALTSMRRVQLSLRSRGK